MDSRELDAGLRRLLDLRTAPVAVTFCDRAPRDVPRAAPEPAGCGYWRAAAEGKVFYTDAADHQGCPIGAHISNVPLDPESAGRLDEMLRTS